jgi:hypothetical protein
MTSTIKVNNIQNQCGANIISESANTITLGASGDNIVLGAGATQSGFGRTGTVDWDTTAKTASFTAVSGNGYFVNTTSGAITVTMPSSPSAGDIVGINDYAGTFATNNVTMGRNGSNFDGTAFDAILSTNQLSVFFVYVDGTQGWKATQNDSGGYGATYIVATGGTITTSGSYKIHTFTGPGTFTVCSVGNPAGSDSVDYLVVAGGGGTPGLGYNDTPSGGGGAGGLRASATTYSIGCNPAAPLVACVSAIPVSVTTYPVTVGAGGSGGSSGSGNVGNSGNNSIFSTITSAGGGRGGHPAAGPAENGGSGGGGTANSGEGSGNTPPVSPPQGNPGGVGVTNPTNPSPGSDNTGLGGGGGAIQSGFSGGNQTPGGGGGDGGDGAGFTNGAFGASNGECVSCVQYFAGGGGGGVYTPNPSPNPGGIGGLGGGGNGGSPANPTCITNPGRVGQNGTANTGGGGASSGGSPSPTSNFVGQSGGSGIVIIRYKYQ